MLDPRAEKLARRGFKYLNRFMLLMWRLGWGKMINAMPDSMGRIMVITHTGRKSGLKRRTPVNYAVVEGELYCTAGFGVVSDWYKNIQKTPQVEVWLPEGRWAGEAEDVSAAPNRLPLMRQVLIGSGFVAPAMGVQPRAMGDESLDKVTQPYRLIHIKRTSPLSGEGGPGDLAWLNWVLGGLTLTVLLLGRLSKGRHS